VRSVLLAVRASEGGTTEGDPAAVRDTLAVIAALAALNVVRHLAPSAGVWVSVTAAIVLVAFARRSGLSWHQLGLSRSQLKSGGLWALGTIAAVSLIYLAGILLPVTRSAFLDSRYHLDPTQALSAAFIGIPLGTVLLEEVAFRSVLWGMLTRHINTRGALAVTSALFGLWHVLPSLHFATSNQGMHELVPEAGATATALVVLGTVAFTAVGGVVAGELRRRSGHVLASAGMHWATNGLGVLFGVIAWRIATR
jgi:membrane protease YdiL (CAAX protease family)